MQDSNELTLADTALSEHALSQQIKTYLEQNPQFFEQYPGLLADLYVPSPHGHGSVSLAERQQFAQRDKIRALETQFVELVQIGHENEVISNKIHGLTLGLLASEQLDILVQVLQHYLSAELNLPNSQLKLWATAKNADHQSHAIFYAKDNLSSTTLDWVKNLSTPYCGVAPDSAIAGWFNDGMQSYAVIPLHSQTVFGLLILGSEDAKRFYPEMGTMFLKRIGELVSAALLRYID